MSSNEPRWQRALDIAPFAAAAAGGFAQKILHQGVERGVLELAGAAAAFLLLAWVVRPRVGLGPSATRIPVAVGLVFLGFLAVLVYPLHPLPGRALVLLELAALGGDLLAARAVGDVLARRASLACALLAVLFAVATHAVAAAGTLDYDPALYFLNGRWLMEGFAPYRDSHLSKMPVILAPNALYALAKDARFLPQVVSLATVLATGAILARSPALTRDPLRGLVFAVSVALLSLEPFRQGGGYPETYAAPLLALAWARLAAPEPRPRDLVIGGAALALLALTKQTHGAYVLALLALVALTAERGRAFADTALVVLGGVATTALVLAPFAVTGLMGPLLDSTVSYWLRRPPTLATEGTLGERLVSLAIPVAPLVLLAFAAAARVAARRVRGPVSRPALGFFFLLATACALQVVEQRIFKNPHYVLNAFVALALAPWILARVSSTRQPLARALVVALAAWSLVPFAEQALSLPAALDAARAKRALIERLALAADETPPDARVPLLVLGGWPQIYVASRRPCVDPRTFTGLLLAQEAATGPAGAARVRALLRTRPLVVVTIEPSNELDLLDEQLPGWRDELRDLDWESVVEDGRWVSVRRPR